MKDRPKLLTSFLNFQVMPTWIVMQSYFTSFVWQNVMSCWYFLINMTHLSLYRTKIISQEYSQFHWPRYEIYHHIDNFVSIIFSFPGNMKELLYIHILFHLYFIYEERRQETDLFCKIDLLPLQLTQTRVPPPCEPRGPSTFGRQAAFSQPYKSPTSFSQPTLVDVWEMWRESRDGGDGGLINKVSVVIGF